MYPGEPVFTFNIIGIPSDCNEILTNLVGFKTAAPRFSTALHDYPY